MLLLAWKRKYLGVNVIKLILLLLLIASKLETRDVKYLADRMNGCYIVQYIVGFLPRSFIKYAHKLHVMASKCS